MNVIKNYIVNSHCLTFVLAAFFLVAAFGNVVRAQENAAANTNQANANTANANVAATPTPIPFSDIVQQAESASATLKELASGISADTIAEIVERDLPELTGEIDAKLEETARVIEGRASLEKLKSFETEWKTLTKNLPDWKDDLTTRAKKLEGDLKQLNTIRGKVEKNA